MAVFFRIRGLLIFLTFVLLIINPACFGEDKSLAGPQVVRFYQTEQEKVFTLESRLPIEATHYKIYFSLQAGRLGDICRMVDRRSMSFSVPELSYSVYYVTIRSYNAKKDLESQNGDQRIVPIYQRIKYIDENGSRYPLTSFMYASDGSIYARASSKVVRTVDNGDTWQTVCKLPGEAQWTPGGYSIDSKGYLYFSDCPFPKISRDGGKTIEEMRDASGAPLYFDHATQFWKSNWNITEILPGMLPNFPDGVIFLSTYANIYRGPSSDLWNPPGGPHFDPNKPAKAWYDQFGNMETDDFGYGRQIFYSADPERKIWQVYQVPENMAQRHIHGFKVNPYNPSEWWLSCGGYETDLALRNRTVGRGLFRTTDNFQTWEKMDRPGVFNGPTGLSFYPDGSLLIGDDTPLSLYRKAGIYRLRNNGAELDFINPYRFNRTLSEFIYDTCTIENTYFSFANVTSELVSVPGATYATAIVDNINGRWDILIKVPIPRNSKTQKNPIIDEQFSQFGNNSRNLIPSTAKYVFNDGLGGIRIPIPPRE